jgi:transcriptional regulator with XRE-family HTH domain
VDLQHQLGERVRELRSRLGLTQRELAQRCGGGFVVQRIGEIERGEANCTLQTIGALSRGLRCEPLDLFLFAPQESNRPPQLPDRRLRELWNGADERLKGKILRILNELLA